MEHTSSRGVLLVEILVLARQLLFLICFVPEHQASLFIIEYLDIIFACTQTKEHKMWLNLS